MEPLSVLHATKKLCSSNDCVGMKVPVGNLLRFEALPLILLRYPWKIKASAASKCKRNI